MIEQKIRNAILPLYLQLIKDIRQSNHTDDLVCFAAQWGRFFPKKEKDGILFVGRATNGWFHYTPDITVLFGTSENAIFNRPDQMRWVDDLDGSQTGYNSRKSAFWRVIRRISKHLYPEPEISYVAWSNVCKIAPNVGNPSNALYYLQLETCKKIIKAEIESFSPRFVIFLTGWGWCKDFVEYLIPNYQKHETKNEKWGNYLVHTYDYCNRIYIVSEHPQGKPEHSHVEAITRSIDNYR
ncbi:MAG: hypothetical protein IK103_03985 [Bacteroidales bacterium]|nr:hypothetical protein [Bacteroidales bacterium]